MSIKISYQRYEEIKRCLVDLYDQYDVNTLPINGFELAKKMEVKIIPYSSFDFKTQSRFHRVSRDGFCLEDNNGQWYICYNDFSYTVGRINNTILHEIGHIILNHSEHSELAEKEAKFFAKYALAPPVLIYLLELNSPEEIKRYFEISTEAARYAYVSYNTWLDHYKRVGFLEDYELKMIELFEKEINRKEKAI